MTKLEKVLSEIDPNILFRAINMKVDSAFNDFVVTSTTIQDIGSFNQCVASFVFYARIPTNVAAELKNTSLDSWLGFANQYLTKAYGNNGGTKAFRTVLANRNGGIHGVLRMIADVMIDEIHTQQVNSIVCGYWRGLTPQERIMAPGEYISLYKEIIPSDLLDKRNPMLRADFYKALCLHPTWLRNYRNFLR